MTNSLSLQKRKLRFKKLVFWQRPQSQMESSEFLAHKLFVHCVNIFIMLNMIILLIKYVTMLCLMIAKK